MTLDSIPSGRQRWVLTDYRLEQLKELSAQGASLTEAARELTVDRKTIVRAAAKRNMSEWLKNAFPPAKPVPRARKKENLSQATASKSAVRLAATTAWR